ncbi:unnamed protein product [Lactuca saligna]|uniref:Uncharacterized protein n=1 Tax=Lactuca saligna TaxID=75948 RepID=A0AA35YZR8_LACSI|nr:unnamed protein product [Lactuca saligna]
MNLTQELVVETTEPIVVETCDHVSSIATITQESEPVVKLVFLKELQFNPEEEDIPNSIIMSAGATTRLVELNKDYSKDLKDKYEKDDKVFEKVEEFLSGIKDTLSKVDLSNQSSISQESISKMVSNIESSIKAELDPILNLVIPLPTNAQCTAQVSQGGEREVGSSNAFGEDKGVVIRKTMSTQIPTKIPMKHVIVSSKTNFTTGNFDQSKVQSKGISINEGAGGSSSTPVKTNSNNDLKDKGKTIEVL